MLKSRVVGVARRNTTMWVLSVALLLIAGAMTLACSSPTESNTSDCQYGFRFQSAAACKSYTESRDCRSYSYNASSGGCTGLRCRVGC